MFCACRRNAPAMPFPIAIAFVRAAPRTRRALRPPDTLDNHGGTMSNAYVIGAGMTKFGRHPERSIEGLAVEAIIAALRDAQLEWRQVQQMYAAHVQQG